MKTIATTFTFLLTTVVASIANAAPGQGPGMMNDSNMMDGGMMMSGGMMVMCMVVLVLGIVALGLGILALIKYLRDKT